jgi:hypothetical protein
MANPTTNYGFVLPTPTDLVTDLPADFEVALQGVDTQMKTNADAATQKATLTTTGDVYYASAASTPARLGIGTTGQVLTVTGGVPVWAVSPSGGMTLLSTTTLSGATTTISSISGSYTHLFLYIYGMTNATASGSFRIAPNGNTGITNNFVSGNSASVVTSVPNSYLYPFGSDTTFVRPLLSSNANAIGLTIHNYSSTAGYKSFSSSGVALNSASTQIATIGGGGIQTASGITSLDFSNAGGNMSTGTILLYGVK